MGKIDANYRRLFQHRELLRDLLACVLDAKVFATLDWDRMEPVPTSYISDKLHQRIGDGAWRIPYRGQTDAVTQANEAARYSSHHDSAQQVEHLYILLLFEQQSRPDAIMALRVAVYAGLLYESLLRDRRIRLPLPPLLPVVLYSGNRPWRAATDFSALLGHLPDELAAYQLGMRYLLVSERALLKSGSLADDNLATLLFRMSRSRDLEQWRALLHTLIQAVRGPAHEELNRSLTAWLRYVAQRSANPAEDLPPVTTLQELDMMISEKPGIWAEQWKQEGLAQGLTQGRTEGQSELLLRQIQRRFGDIPEEVVTRVKAATEPQLERWALNFVDAQTLDDVFRD